MKAKCQCESRFTCVYCLANRPAYHWTSNGPHEEYLARVYKALPPEKREAAYRADRYHADDASRVTGGEV